VEVSCQLQALADLASRKKPVVPIAKETGWAQNQYGCRGKEKNLDLKF
jgi:hypothetical protein